MRDAPRWTTAEVYDADFDVTATITVGDDVLLDDPDIADVALGAIDAAWLKQLVGARGGVRT